MLISKKEDAPFEICQIEEISVTDWVEGSMVDPSKVKLKVRQFLRPTATKLKGANMLCPHLLYYWDKSNGNVVFQQLALYLRVHFFMLAFHIKASDIRGTAYVAYLANTFTKDTHVWVTQGSTRFYFMNKYNMKKGVTEKLPTHAKKMLGDIDPQVCSTLYVYQ